MRNGKQFSIMGMCVPRSITVPSPTLFLNIIMAIYTYIPEKNCNIVQTEADVAIMSLNPSIANYQTVDFCISKKKENWWYMNVQQLKTSKPNIHYKSYSTGHFLMPNKCHAHPQKLFPYRRQDKKFYVSRHRRYIFRAVTIFFTESDISNPIFPVKLMF